VLFRRLLCNQQLSVTLMYILYPWLPPQMHTCTAITAATRMNLFIRLCETVSRESYRVCLVGFSRQPGCVSQDHWSLALQMRPICSYLVSLAQDALRIVRVWIQIYMQATKHRARTRIAWLITTKQQLPASHGASTRRCRQPNRP
jgi:hypothetical protein